MASPQDPSSPVPETGDPLLVLERMDEGFFAIGRDWRFAYCNAAAARFWGLARDDMLGRTMFELFPRFLGSPAHAAHREAMETGAEVRVETISTATSRPVELRIFPSAAGLSVYFSDLTRRLELEQEVEARDDLLSLAELSAGIGLWVGDLDKASVWARPEFYRLLGIEPIEGTVPVDLPRSYRHPDDRARVTEGFQRALESGAETHDTEYRIVRADGEQRWIFGRGRISRDAAGRPWRYSGVDIDITERKKQEEHLRLVMGELLHRNNNLLTVVQSLVRQTARNADGIADFVPALTARLRGLGESGSLLAREEWRGAPLDELIRAQVASFDTSHRVALDGPRIMLSPRATQNLGMAFHELCTNAVKYGALSVPNGRVRVGWELRDGALTMTWTERDGPPVARPTRTGFGHVVTEQMLASALGAKVETRFAPAGIAWTLTLPSEEFVVPAA